MRRGLLLLAVLIAAAGCGNEKEDPAAISSQAEAFINSVLRTMENESSYRAGFVFEKDRIVREVFAEARGAQSIEDTYPAIEKALELLGDMQSYLVDPDDRAVAGNLGQILCVASPDPNPVPSIPSDLGYLSVREHIGNTPEQTALNLQERIALLSNPDIRGWIVDLRNLQDGDFPALLAGLAPLLGEGLLGGFNAGDVLLEWRYTGGSVSIGSETPVALGNPLSVPDPLPRVAILVDMGTAGPGEYLFAAFKNRPDSRSFGNATCGRAYTEVIVDLAGGHRLFLNAGPLSDRTGMLYGNTYLLPDESDGAAVSFPQVLAYFD
jgi:carboxyl-terminal processing protease